jgi:hypothetical protein
MKTPYRIPLGLINFCGKAQRSLSIAVGFRKIGVPEIPLPATTNISVSPMI